ncbi:hypothetical protein DSCW_36500 [Desulfosarcina widdelii]|uniref:Uncharacterized protein n=1 Tax=Desulfosarcina widdelii TaxID=947919 RepID=A0A5K7Z8P6_9BACT|nr:hypothetical protein [Desulfosarcina widdelii]BBO76233.1 hypothetical protein DSCW_36500 [Desulfosarcina widdelii]
MFEILHFRKSEKILSNKNLLEDVQATMQYIDDVLTGALYTRELLRMALDEMDWTGDIDSMRIIENRRYMYKGVKRGVAIDGNVSAYEYILEGLVRLQIGYDKRRIEAGILIVNSKRSDKSPLGTTADLIKAEIETLYPTIHLPVAVCLISTGEPILFDEEGNPYGSVSVSKDDNPAVEKATQG